MRKVGRDIEHYVIHATQVDKILSESIARLENGEVNAEEVITELSRRRAALSHAPSKLMRKAASEGDSELLDFVVSGLHDAYRDKG